VTADEIVAALADTTPGSRVVRLARETAEARFQAAVARGLSARPRAIPPACLYDARGSALYEAIVELPEYYPARTEEALLGAITTELAALLRHHEVVELGSGSSWKTRRILAAMGAGARPLTYVPVDVNPGMLAASGAALCEAFPGLAVRGLASRFEDALASLTPAPARLFVFLGGTIGNLSPDEQDALFNAMARAMGPGSHLLLGFDRRAHAGKPAQLIHLAYNDARGVTAEFNLNLLVRLRRELGATIRLESWSHQAFYDSDLHRIEMHLRALEAQVVAIPSLGLEVAFEAGEGILTEISRKFDPDELAAWCAACGFAVVASWSDPAERFGLLLLAGPS